MGGRVERALKRVCMQNREKEEIQRREECSELRHTSGSLDGALCISRQDARKS